MPQQCAFISQLSNTEQQNWLDKLNAKLPNVRVMLAREMSVAEKQQCKVAVVANPKPEDLSEFPQLVWVQSLWAGVEKLTKVFTFLHNFIIQVTNSYRRLQVVTKT